MKNHTKKISTIIVLSLLTLLTTSDVYAQDQKPYVKDGTYIGVHWTSNHMSGDFDDSTSYSAPGELLDVPDLDDGTGLGFVLGFRAKKGAFEFGYQRSRHDVSGVIHEEGDGTYNVIDLNIKIDAFARNKVKPYILLGFGFPWLTIENCLYDYYSGWEDATFHGLALNAGVGAAYYFRPNMAVDGGFLYRWNRFSSAEGKSLDNSLVERALCFRIGLAYTF